MLPPPYPTLLTVVARLPGVSKSSVAVGVSPDRDNGAHV